VNRLAKRIGWPWVCYTPFTSLEVFVATTLAHGGWNGSACTLAARRTLEAAAAYTWSSITAGRGRCRTSITVEVAGRTLPLRMREELQRFRRRLKAVVSQ
jgi:hypothetical protein